MTDWLKGMRQTYEYYKVDPYTWADYELLNNIESCTISRDEETDIKTSVSLTSSEDIGECYLRVYIVANQNGIIEKHPLGTFLVSHPGFSYDGKKRTYAYDGYSPLTELKDNYPPIGYSVLKNSEALKAVAGKTKEICRAPLIGPEDEYVLYENVVALPSDNWFEFLNYILNNVNYSYDVDERGNILFKPVSRFSSLSPIWSYNDNNSSILLPDITDENDLLDVPNVVEVIYSKNSGAYLYSKAVNNFENSITSTVNRGRVILYRDTDPTFPGVPTQDLLDEYAEKLLRDFSSLQHTIRYSHGYCPVRVGDCVMLNYKSAGLYNVRAKVISQSIECKTGCVVEETAVYTTNLLG